LLASSIALAGLWAFPAATLLHRTLLSVLSNVGGIRVAAPLGPFASRKARQQLFRSLTDRVHSLCPLGPTAWTNTLPFVSNGLLNLARLIRSGADGGKREQLVTLVYSGGGHLSAVGIQLRAGRYFDPGSLAPEMVIEESLARARYGGVAAVGERVEISGQEYEIVGLAPAASHSGGAAIRTPPVYLSSLWNRITTLETFVVRTPDRNGSLARQVAGYFVEESKGVTPTETYWLEDRLAKLMHPERTAARVAGLLAALGILIGCFGACTATLPAGQRQGKTSAALFAPGVGTASIRTRLARKIVLLQAPGAAGGIGGAYGLMSLLEHLFELSTPGFTLEKAVEDFCWGV
jgi:hypothetical protein